uniref:Uncharacterized protein n=1 Tax=viral metagenome TaxID=1070528 RepID=A0A6M3LF17_9ZZZZ
MNKKTIFVGKIENYELIPGPETQGFAIFFDKPFDIKLIAEWVGRKTKITFEEQD